MGFHAGKTDSFWNNRIVWIVNIMAALLLALLVIKALQPPKTFVFEGSFQFEEGQAVNDRIVFQELKLKQGVYLFALNYETDADEQAYCTVADGSVISGGLLTNYEHFYSQLGQTNFGVWLFEEAKHLQVRVNYTGVGKLKVGNLSVTQTNRLWTMLIICLLFVWTVFIMLAAYRYYDAKGFISTEKKNVFFWLMVITLIASVPYLYGFNVSGADFTYHLQRIEGVKDGILSGFFPVRLEPKWVYDHGYANAIFYCNLLLIFPALLRIFGFPVSFSYSVFAIAMNALTVWIAYYCYKRMFKSSNIGLACSALYTISVFRIYKFVITSAVGEGTAFTFLPLILYGFYRIFTEDPQEKKYKSAWIPIAIGLAGVLQTHVLTCEITVFVILLFCLFYIKYIFQKGTFANLFRAACAALLLSLWFVVPFLDFYITQDVHIKHVSARTIQSSGLEPAHLMFHFWTTGIYTPSAGQGLEHSHPVGIGLILVCGAMLFGYLWFTGAFRNQKFLELRFFKVTLAIGIFLMGASLNSFPWDQIQAIHPILASLVSSLQFPNRFLGWGTACLVAIIGFCMKYFGAKMSKWYWGLILGVVFSVATSGIRLLDLSIYNSNLYELYNQAAMGYGYISGAEYVLEGTDYEQLTYAKPIEGENIEISSYHKKMLGADFACVNRAEYEDYVELPLLYYKGYQAEDQDTGKEIELCAGDNNKIWVIVPGNYTGHIYVRYVSPYYWRVAEGISLITVLLFLALLWKDRRRIDE